MNGNLCFLFKYIYRNAYYSVLKESILLCVVQYTYIYIYSRGISFLLEKNRYSSDLLELYCTMMYEDCSGNLKRQPWEHGLIITNFLDAFFPLQPHPQLQRSSISMPVMCHFLN